ncbi:UvrD-helicase domain-containing protein [Bacillus salacetis]|uniref:UvrD-helicase domain-containing protein n=1 Tax=Bacillus salacetis TaxID=2315464 RepID=UPI003BA2158C
MINFTQEDIGSAESLFLPGSNKFSEEVKGIIECVESKDIIACPGSGKTTTLLAKLSIIGKQLPLENNKGICVLTHTNVAINEIKERLGVEGNKLFEYPNFFGTIQSFVNQFLAIPYFNNTFKRHVSSIDDEIYNSNILREFYSLDYGIQFGFGKKYGDSRDRIHDALKEMRYAFDEEILIDKFQKSLYKSQGKILLALKRIKQEVMEKGILCYDDAYWLSVQYLKKCEVPLRNFMSERFAFMFIDEMQDTSHLQNEILDKLFDKEQVIIQRFGDPNQSIYDDSDNMAWNIWDGPLKITDSKRNSEIISKLISPFELIPSGMKGNGERETINPKLFVYDTESITSVLSEFANTIYEHGLHSNPNNTFKAVGRIAKESEDDKVKIPSYFPQFNQKSNSIETKKLYLVDFINKDAIDQGQNRDAGSYYNSLISALLRALWLLEVKTNNGSYYNKKTLLKEIITKDKHMYIRLEENLVRWCLMIRKGYDIKQDFIIYTNELLEKVFGITDLSILSRFYKRERLVEDSIPATNNVFHYTQGENNTIEIYIDTVAGVKGETHAATLFLETNYYSYDVKQLIGAFKGEMKGKRGKREISALKHAYVAMSRPTDLLCVAAQRSSIEGHEEELSSAGWDLVYVQSTDTEDDKGQKKPHVKVIST